YFYLSFLHSASWGVTSFHLFFLSSFLFWLMNPNTVALARPPAPLNTIRMSLLDHQPMGRIAPHPTSPIPRGISTKNKGERGKERKKEKCIDTRNALPKNTAHRIKWKR